MTKLGKILIFVLTLLIIGLAVYFSHTPNSNITENHSYGFKHIDGDEEHPPYGGAKRSDKWQTVRKHFLETHPCCAICGTTKNLNVHHKKPFHEHPELELDFDNLVTLCKTDHFVFGHLHDYKSYNPNIDEDIKIWSKKIKQRP